jgi:hypothetical protein
MSACVVSLQDGVGTGSARGGTLDKILAYSLSHGLAARALSREDRERRPPAV